MQPSGLSAEELFVRGQEITYDDVTILDSILSLITKDKVSLKTSLGKGIDLALPIIASPMDSVVSPEMAIALAQIGGIAVIHYNHKDAEGNPSIGKQTEEIRRVKRAQNGFIEEPTAVSPDMTLFQVVEMRKKYERSGRKMGTFPVTENGKNNGRLVGLLRREDYFEGSNLNFTVAKRMLGLEKLITGQSGISLEEARGKLWKNHIKALPIVDEEGNLAYLVTKGDIEKSEQFPNATIDSDDRLRVLFAVDTWPNSHERLEKGFDAGADGVVVDTSQGHTGFAHDMLRYVANNYPDKLLIGGNISTAEAADTLAEFGYVDAYRCGQSSGSICTTADTIGIGRAAATAVYECAKAVRDIGSDMVTIADGGLRSSGDIYKALAFGAGTVMLGSMLAGHKECPGEVVDDNGRLMMEYWGMGSAKAMVGGNLRMRNYGGHEEGIAKKVLFKGELHEAFPKITDALLHAFEVGNFKNINELHVAVENGDYRFGRRSIASLLESKPHD